jgi:hypothetical protein
MRRLFIAKPHSVFPHYRLDPSSLNTIYPINLILYYTTTMALPRAPLLLCFLLLLPQVHAFGAGSTSLVVLCLFASVLTNL